MTTFQAQLDDPESFVSILKSMLMLRESLGIAHSELIDIPQVGGSGFGNSDKSITGSG